MRSLRTSDGWLKGHNFQASGERQLIVLAVAASTPAELGEIFVEPDCVRSAFCLLDGNARFFDCANLLTLSQDRGQAIVAVRFLCLPTAKKQRRTSKSKHLPVHVHVHDIGIFGIFFFNCKPSFHINIKQNLLSFFPKAL